jgi:hypothetical protein
VEHLLSKAAVVQEAQGILKKINCKFLRFSTKVFNCALVKTALRIVKDKEYKLMRIQD